MYMYGTYRLLREDGALHKLVYDKRVVLLQSGKVNHVNMTIHSEAHERERTRRRNHSRSWDILREGCLLCVQRRARRRWEGLWWLKVQLYSYKHCQIVFATQSHTSNSSNSVLVNFVLQYKYKKVGIKLYNVCVYLGINVVIHKNRSIILQEHWSPESVGMWRRILSHA